MTSEYSVGTTNRYAFFLDDEDDPGDTILPASSRPEKSDKDATTTAAGSKAKKADKAAPKGKGKENKEKLQQQLNAKKATLEAVSKG